MALTILDPAMLSTATRWVAEQLSNNWAGDPPGSTDPVDGRTDMGDIAWADLLSSPDSRANGLSAAADPDAPPSPTPTVSEFINAANWTYSRDESGIPAGLRPFEVDGEHLTQEIAADGFYGAAFVTPENQVIVAFEGTHLSALDDDPVFVLAQIAADGQIHLGQAPDAYGDALRFTQTVLAAAQADGIAPFDVFVTGHSLGGAEAQYVAAQLDVGGQTFGGPGIPEADIPAGATPSLVGLVNYVEYGDPVGNYSADPDYLGGFLYSDAILRYGDATYIGDPLARSALEAAGALFGPGTTPAENATGIAALAGLAGEYHVLTAYAADLGVTLDDPGAYGVLTMDTAALLGFATAGLTIG